MTTVPLIPRKLFFGNPDRAAVRLSPDGAFLSWLAPLDGVLNLWVAPRDDPEAARPVTRDTGRGIHYYTWAYTCTDLLYVQDRDGDENYRLYAADVTSSPDAAPRDLTPLEGVRAQIEHLSPRHPGELLVGLNDRDPTLHDLYRLDLRTGERTLLCENPGFMGFVTDDDLRLRAVMRQTPEGGLEVLAPADGRAADGRSDESWTVWQRVPPEDAMTTGPLGFDKSGDILFAIDSRGRDTAALVAFTMDTDETALLAEDGRADVAQVLVHPTEKHIQAVAFTYDRKRWQILDPAIEPDLVRLRQVADGEVEVTSRTLDDSAWTVAYVVDDGPLRFYLYDRHNGSTRFLFTDRQALTGLPLACMHALTFPARDGQDLVAYLTLPPGSDPDGDGVPDAPLPLVLTPHGGPWWRDFWGFNPYHQWLANRGYAVLAVNFRASTGLGKAFLNAGNQQWAGIVIEDQQDAVHWAIDRGIAHPARVGVMGGSFGGYSTLAGLTFTPDLFACGVDLFGPANLVTLLESVPPYWKPMFEMFATRVGDPRTDAGRALLKAHSPLTHAESIRRPLLIGQGANDARVKQAESDQIVEAMQTRGIPVTYLLYPDEGHGFARPENNLSFHAIAERFLARTLGGRCESFGNDLEGSSVQVLVDDLDLTP
jgi:dipeptidyl aminopeptidase/acylaminoacyl peptidase